MEKITIPVMFWQHIETYCVNMAISVFCPQLWAIAPTAPFCKIRTALYFVAKWQNFPKRKADYDSFPITIIGILRVFLEWIVLES
jgi:hypothetical protein